MNFDNEEFNELLNKYLLGKDVLENKLNNLIDDFVKEQGYNPVEHLKSRIKCKDSIINKLHNKGLDVTIDNIVNNVKDIVGIRLVCSFLTDVYDLVNLISNKLNINIIERKDFIVKPKESGYSSYHLIVLVPIMYKGKKDYIKAEIQIRTVAQDFWASLNHKLQYKYEDMVPENIKREMYEYSLIVKQLDRRMVSLKNEVNGCK